MATAQSLTVATGDGLSLELSPKGRVTGLAIGKTKLPLRGAGGFAIADFHNQPEPKNLVPNPGFEAGREGWGLGKGQAIVHDITHSGQAAVRLEVPGPQPGSSNVGCLVPVKPNRAYRAELWLRREKVGVCGAYVSERDEKNKLTGKRTQVGVTIPKQDGVWHKLTWEVRTQPQTTRLSLRADIYRSTGTLWLDDFSIVEVSEAIYQPVEGAARKAGDHLEFEGALPQAGLQLRATLKGDRECLRVDGVVSDTTGRDRAVGVAFRLPLDLTGWTWYNDAEEHATIEAGGIYRHTYDCESGIGLCSIYPWSALSGPQAGLTLALPLSQGPRVFLLQHDQRGPQTSVIFYFGLAKDAARNPSRAPFSFVIYRHDPTWGMRSAMERYYHLFPESFVKRPTYEGYLNYAGLERYDARMHQLSARGKKLDDAGDFGEGYRFLWHMHGCYDFRMVPSNDPKRPSDEVVMSLLQQMVQQEREKPRGYVPTSETLKKLVYDANGQIRYIGDTRYWRAQEGYNRTDQPGWGLNFRVNEDPGVSQFLADVSRRKLEEYAKDKARRPFEACFTADAIEGYFGNTRGLDYRREHFRTTDVPLTFGRESLKVAMPNTIWDFHAKVWWPLTQQYRVVTYGNANGYEQAFTMPFVDIPMIEWEWDRGHPERFERYLRAICHHKIWRFWRVLGQGEKDPPSVRRHFARGLAYAVYPCVWALALTPEGVEPYRDLFRQYVPAIEELSRAGWEPVPHARAGEGVIVERYGSYEKGELHFTLRNYADEAREPTVRIGRQALGIPAGAELVAVDILPRQPTPVHIEPGNWKVQVEADGARAFWVGTRDMLSQHGFRLAGETLGAVERLFATELSEASRQALEDCQKLALRGAAATGSDALRIAYDLQQAAEALESSLETKSPVDRAKLFFRLRTDLACVPVGVLGLKVSGPRVIAQGLRGEAVPAACMISCTGDRTLSQVKASVRSPWPEVAKECRASGLPSELKRGVEAPLRAKLFIPAEPPRALMPYLVEVSGRAGEVPFAAAVPVDVRVGVPVSVGVAPNRVFRGSESKIGLTVTNRLKESGQVRIKFRSPRSLEMTPSELTLELPAGRQVERMVTCRAAGSARIGGLTIPYTISSENAKFNLSGSIAVVTSDPVPRVAIKRTAEKPTIDGKLAEAVWRRPPTIPELRMLAGGGPATEQTAVWGAYDDQGVYFALRCAESQMDKLQAKLTERGAPLYREDDVELFLLPPGAPRAFQFAINALGTRSDNFGNKANWVAAARRSADAWTVEVFIPYGAVGVSAAPRRGSSWACQFGRQQKPKGETTAWTPGRAFNMPEGFGEVIFD